MDIIVCIKQVPDTSEVKIDNETNNLVREGVPSIINPYDVNGVEEALRLRDEHGGKVTVVSMGPPQAKEALRYCLGMGADEAVLLSDPVVSGSDTLATGYALSQLIAAIDYDLIICGSEAIDGCTGQVGPIIAGNLGLTQFTYVRKLRVDSGRLMVQREIGRNIENYESVFPALVCVLKDINRPRKATGTTKQPRVVTAGDIGFDTGRVGNAGSPTKVIKIEISNAKAKSYVMIDDSLSWENRIKMIINGGISRKEKIDLWRGSVDTLAQRLIEQEEFSKFLETV